MSIHPTGTKLDPEPIRDPGSEPLNTDDTRSGHDMATDITVTNNPERRRYEASTGGTTAGFLEYQETSELVVLRHTEVDAAVEGRGVGSALARAALEDIRDRGLKALVICPFVLGWLRNHREYREVLYTASMASGRG